MFQINKTRRLKYAYVNGLLYFVYADDWPAANYPKNWLFDTIEEAHEASVAPPGECASYKGVEFNILRALLDRERKTVILDIGANYGREGIRYSHFRRALGVKGAPDILAFEPGPVAAVAQMNYDLHGANDICLYNCAVGAEDGKKTFWIEPSSTLSGSFAIESVKNVEPHIINVRALDSVLNEICADAPLFMKVDTQGAEHLVLSGMRNYLKRHIICGVFEFSPQLLSKISPPADFLRELTDSFIVYDLGSRRTLYKELKSHDGFTEEIDVRSPRYTDLMIIDKRF